MCSAFPDALLEREIEAICKSYRIAPEDARGLCEEYIRRRPDLLGKILPKVSEQDVTRLKAYKTLMKDVRKQIYYYLRQYQPGKDTVERLRQELAAAIAASATQSDIAGTVRQLLSTHVSTRERLEQYQEFYDTLFRLVEPPRTILDVGCGIHPLSYPYACEAGMGFVSHSMGVNPDLYVAVDKQPDVIETLQGFAPAVAPTRFIAICTDIGEFEWEQLGELTPRPPLLEREGEKSGVAPTVLPPLSFQERGPGGEFLFDLALMLKLIPVIARQQRHLLSTLAALPARRMLITATTEAMTRKHNIRKREERLLRDFIELSGRRVQAAFQVGDEFGFLLDEPEAGTRQKIS